MVWWYDHSLARKQAHGTGITRTILHCNSRWRSYRSKRSEKWVGEQHKGIVHLITVEKYVFTTEQDTRLLARTPKLLLAELRDDRNPTTKVAVHIMLFAGLAWVSLPAVVKRCR